MENKAHALAAGLFTLLLGAAFVAAAMWFSRDDVHYVPYLVSTNTSVTGLKVEAPVRYRGVEVGRVRAIRIDPGAKGEIRITIGVAKGTPVTRSTFARLGYQGVTGLAYVALDDSGGSKELLPSTSRNMAEIPLHRSIMDKGEDLVAAFSDIAARAKKLLDDDNLKALHGALVGLNRAAVKTAALADKAAVLADKAGRVADKTSALVDKVGSGVSDVTGLVHDARGTIANAKAMIATLNGVASKIGERVNTLNRVASGVAEVGSTAQAVHDETLPRINALVADLRKETLALDRLINSLDEHPQSIVFGTPAGSPGPGEPGFSAEGSR